MADTRHHAGPAPVEGDGVSYTGIVWFIVILTATTIFCQVLVWGVFEWMDARARDRDVVRPALAAAPVEPAIVDGRIEGASRSGPAILVNEPATLGIFREAEALELTTYGWVDRNTGVVRIPIERAKELILERGLPSR